MTAVRITVEAVRGFMADDALELSAGLAYRFFLAIVPFFIFVASLSGFVAAWLGAPDLTERVRQLVAATVPSNVGGILTDQLHDILSERRPGALSVGLLFTLLAATGATTALIGAMNRAYDVTESRPFLRKQAVAIGLTLLAAAAILVSLAILVATRFFASEIASLLHVGTEYQAVIGLAPLPFVFVALALASGMLYWIGPNVSHPPRAVIPGAVLFPAAWLAATYGFSLYVELFGGYQKTYGALGAVAVFLVWLYIDGALLVAGAELNAAVAKVTRPAELRRQRQQTRDHATPAA